MKNHRKKMIAPIVIAILFLAYLVGCGIRLMTVSESDPLYLLLIIPAALMGGGMVYVLIVRIREIRSGEEDDLSDY